MFLIGILLLAGMIIFYAMAIWATVVAPRKAASGNVWFLAATRFLLFRFRTDIWWFGTFMLPRGLMLSLSIVMAGDSPYVQMLLIVSVMLTYMVVQLVSWPWKLPALNAFDAVISIELILMMAILGAFAPDLSSDIQQRLTSAVIGIITFLNVMVLLMLCVTASALIRLNVMGGSQESVILALGKIPQPEMLSNKFLILCSKIKELGEDNFTQLLSNLSIYDLRMTAQIITAVGSEVRDGWVTSLWFLRGGPIWSPLRLLHPQGTRTLTRRSRKPWQSTRLQHCRPSRCPGTKRRKTKNHASPGRLMR